MNDPTFLAAIIAALAAVLCGFLTFRASSRANQIAGRKVDQDAYDRALKWRDEELARVTAQAERLAQQIERISTQLAAEQDVSNVLRNQIRTLQSQVETLKLMIEDLKSRTNSGILNPLPHGPKSPPV